MPVGLSPLDGVRAVLFDVYGTLFDVYSIGRAAERAWPGHGERLALLWREKQIEYTRLVSMSGRRRTFRDCTRGGLRFACKRLGLALSPGDEAELVAAYDRLEPFPESRGVLEALRARGLRAGVLSNGDADMLETLVAHAGFSALLDPVLSVEACGRFKTDPAAYALGTAALNLDAEAILFVSSNNWDAIGATWFGHTALWVNRHGLPADELDTAPAHTGRTLEAVFGPSPAHPAA